MMLLDAISSCFKEQLLLVLFNNICRNVVMLKRGILVFLLFPDSVPDHVEGGSGSAGPLCQPGFQLYHQQYLWRERGECWLVLLYTELCCSPLCITEQSFISLPILSPHAVSESHPNPVDIRQTF